MPQDKPAHNKNPPLYVMSPSEKPQFPALDEFPESSAKGEAIW